MIVKKALCSFCHRNCGMLVYVDGDQVKDVKPDKTDPISKGSVCVKGLSIIEFHNHPGRLNYPLKRVGERGEGKWERISWDQALDEIAAKLKEIKEKYGPEALAIGKGTYRSPERWAMYRFANLFGTPNLFQSGNICFCLSLFLNIVTYGAFALPHIPELGESKCIILWGKNPANSYPHMWRNILNLKKRGAKLIVIDPRRTEPAQHADLWLRIRPQSDLALALGFLNIIITRSLYDAEFVKNWTNAPFLFDEKTGKLLRESDINKEGSYENFVVWNTLSNDIAVWCSNKGKYKPEQTDPVLFGTYNVRLKDGRTVKCKTVWQKLLEIVTEYTPENVSKITWVDANKIEEAARIYATNKPACIPWGVKQEQIGRGATQLIRTICILRSITGNLDVPGGELLGITGDLLKVVQDYDMELPEKLPKKQREKQLGFDEFKILRWSVYERLLEVTQNCPYVGRLSQMNSCITHLPTLWRAIVTGKPYPIKALIVQGNNPLLSWTNTKLVYQALKKLDLFVVMDYFMTPSAMLADYVLPAASWLERPHIVTLDGCSRNYIHLGERAVKPMYERRTDYELWRGLGTRLGQTEYWLWENSEEQLDYRLRPLGYSLSEFVTKLRGIRGPDEFQKYKKYGFATPSKKVEIYSSIFEEFGYDPLPNYEEQVQPSKDTAENYPLILTTGGRSIEFFHSEFRQINSLRKLHPDPVVQMNSETAKKLGIKDGDWVYIETPLGKVMQRAKLDPHLHPTVVHAEHGWWFPEEPGAEPSLHGLWKSNINVLIHNAQEVLDPISGAWPHMCLCRVYKASK
ncbi:MAG: molybdopterin-dependent oxidoreductase [Candidatus Bathyarchaeia archaeon]